MDGLSEEMETRNDCIWNFLDPYWSTSLSAGEDGPAGVSALDVYVEPPGGSPARRLLSIMRPGRTVAKAVIVGQTGVGKSMALARTAQDLRQAHLLFWVDVVGEGDEIVEDPLELFAAIGVGVYEGARKAGFNPDRKLLEVFLNACFDTVIRETIDEHKFKVKLDQMLKDIAGAVMQLSWGAAMVTGHPGFMVAGGVAASVRALLRWVEWSAAEKTNTRRTQVDKPQTTRAATHLTTFLYDVERRSGKTIVVIVDGLDRLSGEKLKPFFLRGRDLARPDVRLILTAPLTLYVTPAFRQLTEFFPHVVLIPNVRLNDGSGVAEQFLQQVVEERLRRCGTDAESLFAPGALTELIFASGGNVRELLKMAQAALEGAGEKGQATVDSTAAKEAIKVAVGGLRAGLRDDGLRAMRKFVSEPGLRPPPGGAIGDDLLDQKFILVYEENRGPFFEASPLARILLERTVPHDKNE